MGKTRTSFKKGEGGRPAGVPNKTTQEAKELLEKILFGQIDNIHDALDEIRAKDPAKFLDACSKLFTYVLPKKTDVTSDDKPIKPVLNVTVDASDTAKTLEKLRNGTTD